MKVKPLWDYSTESPRVRAHIELDWVPTDIALHVSEYSPGTPEYLHINQAVDLAMTSLLWQTQEISQFGMENEPGYGEVEVQLDSVAGFYFDRRQALRNQAAKQQT